MGPNKIPTKPDRADQNPTDSDRAGTSGQQQPVAKRARASRSRQRQTATSKKTADSNRQRHTAISKRKRYLNRKAAHRDKQRQTAANGAGVQNWAAAPRGTPSEISFFRGKVLPSGRFSRWEEAGGAYLQGVLKWPKVPEVASQRS